MKRVLYPIIGFVLVCIMGAVVMSAGGIQWGTENAGGVVFLTLFLACLGADRGRAKAAEAF